MRSGLLNERLTVNRLVTTTDATGAKKVTLAKRGEYWCRVLHQQHDRNTADVDRIVYNPDIRFELRASVPIDDNDIIEYAGKRYVIVNIEKNRNIDTQTLNCNRYEQ